MEKNSTGKRPLTPPPDTNESGGTFTCSMNPSTLEFVQQWSSQLGFDALFGVPSTPTPTEFNDKPVKEGASTNPSLLQPSSLNFGWIGDNNKEDHFGNYSADTRPCTPTPKGIDDEGTGRGGETHSYSMKPETVEFFRKVATQSFGQLNFPFWDDAVVPSTPPHLVDGSIYGYDDGPPSALDLTWHGRGGGSSNDYEKSPAWSSTPSDEEKEDIDDKIPPPLPLGEVYLRPWYNKRNVNVIHSCLICSQGFVEIEDLRRHEVEKHLDDMRNGPFYCKDCDRGFIFSYEFDDHFDQHQYCRRCGEQLKQAVLNGFQKAAANVLMRGFMRGAPGEVALENYCENCKAFERRKRALKRGATETVTWDEEDEDEEEYEEGESFSEEEEYDEEEEEEIEEYEEETEEEMDEEENLEEMDKGVIIEEMDEEGNLEEMDKGVIIEEMEDDEEVEVKKVQRDIPENELGEGEESEDVDEEEEYEYEDVEEEEVEEEENDDDESMDDEETEDEEEED